jgi:polyphosphate kinase 2
MAHKPDVMTSGALDLAKNKKKREARETSEDQVPASPQLTRKEFEKELRKLQVELTRLQSWAVAEGARVAIVFEGRDTAGKGGVISRITQRCSPRVFKHIALPKPSDRERSQLYIQRYIAHFPAAGEIVLFDRSWYNRAGVERVMGFCSDDEYQHFLRLAPAVEREIVNNGIFLLKYFLDVSQTEQRRRFEARVSDPLKHWKLSPMDVESVRRWWDYTKAYQAMIEATDSEFAPWYVVPADDKRRARLNLISHLLSKIPYRKVAVDLPEIPRPAPRPKGVEAGLRAGQVVPHRY